MRICFVSIDIERDVDTIQNKIFRGVEEVDKTLDIFENFDIPATLFVTGDILAKYPDRVKKWSEKYEIASHSYSHIYFNELSDSRKEADIKKFIEIYEKALGFRALGFRAPSHVVDTFTMGVLARYGFRYDSSIVPHYPYLKKYRGYSGRAPVVPYTPKTSNIRQYEAKRGKGGIVELPVTGQLMGIPLAGAWIRKLPIWFYKTLFLLNKPDYVTLSMHSWDALDTRFTAKLIKILEILKNSDYVFKSGEQIAMEGAFG